MKLSNKKISAVPNPYSKKGNNKILNSNKALVDSFKNDDIKELKTIYCLIGPSASGKSTLIKENKDKLNCGEIVSTTTRQPRNGETNGVDYNFIDREEFSSLDMLEKDEYAGDFYGTSLNAVFNSLEGKKGTMTAITYEGSENIKRYIKENSIENINVISIFIATPKNELEKRMVDRGDSSENIKKRLKNIETRNEYDNMFKTDYIFIPSKSRFKTNDNFCDLINLHEYGTQFFENCSFALENTNSMTRFLRKVKPYLELFPYWCQAIKIIHDDKIHNAKDLSQKLQIELSEAVEILLSMERMELCYNFADYSLKGDEFYNRISTNLSSYAEFLAKTNYIDIFNQLDSDKNHFPQKERLNATDFLPEL